MSNVKMATRKPGRLASPPVRLKDWDEVARYKASHLKPVGRGPKGQPIYAYADVKALNIQYPDEQEA